MVGVRTHLFHVEHRRSPRGSNRPHDPRRLWVSRDVTGPPPTSGHRCRPSCFRVCAARCRPSLILLPTVTTWPVLTPTALPVGADLRRPRALEPSQVEMRTCGFTWNRGRTDLRANSAPVPTPVSLGAVCDQRSARRRIVEPQQAVILTRTIAQLPDAVARHRRSTWPWRQPAPEPSTSHLNRSLQPG